MKLLPLRFDIIINMPPLKRFSKDVKWMTGRKPNLYWQITWRFISPLLLLIVFVAFVTLQIQKPSSYAAWNPKHVCSQIFSKFLINGRVVHFSPLPHPLKSLLSAAYLRNAAWSDGMLRMRRLQYAQRLWGYMYWNAFLLTGPLLEKTHICRAPYFFRMCVMQRTVEVKCLTDTLNLQGVQRWNKHMSRALELHNRCWGWKQFSVRTTNHWGPDEYMNV